MSNVRRITTVLTALAVAALAPAAPAATSTTGAVVGPPTTKAGTLRIPVLVKRSTSTFVLKATRVRNPQSLRYGDRVTVRSGRATIRRTGHGPSFATLAAHRAETLATAQRAVDGLATAQRDLAAIPPGTALTAAQVTQLDELKTTLNLLSRQLDTLTTSLQSAIDAANTAFGPQATLATKARRARDRQVSPLEQLRDAAHNAVAPVDATVAKLDTAISTVPGTLPQLPIDASPTLVVNTLIDVLNTLFPPQP
jgi:hypothetical protein